MLINRFNWRDAILHEENSDAGQGSGTGADDFDKARAMATIEKLREFEKEAKRLQKQLSQYEGKTILEPDQAAQWAEYQKLGALSDITKALQERDAVKAELTIAKRAQQVREVAEQAGYNVAVLSQLDSMDSLTYEKKTVTQDGKNVSVIMVSGGKTAQPVTLQEYASTHWKDFLPALQPSAVSPGMQFAPQLNGSHSQFATPEQVERKMKQSGLYYAL